MSGGNLVVEAWQRLPRRSRYLLVICSAIVGLLLTVHFNADLYYAPQYITSNPNVRPDYDYYGKAYESEPIAADDATAARCDWAEVDVKATRKIRGKTAPSFPLLSGWLKPEAGEEFTFSELEWSICFNASESARFGPALKAIPLALQDGFTMGRRIRFEEWFFDQVCAISLFTSGCY
jgi:hypothetical protein